MTLDTPQAPQVSIMTTPVEEDEFDTKYMFPTTPSPQAVDELESTAVTSANRSAVVSRMLSYHLVTVNDEEVIVSSSTVTLPELELEGAAMANHYDENDVGTDATRINPATSTPTATPRHTPPMPIQHKMLYQSVSSIASPIRAEDLMPQLRVGPEREVLFHTESLGIKISRHTDGYVRVLSVTPYRSATTGADKVREGDIYEGDVVREISDVNLRMPIDSAVWKLTVGLVKMAPRPLKFVVARELQISTEEEEAGADAGNLRSDDPTGISDSIPKPLVSSTQTDRERFGPTREIHFFESALGVKLHHNLEGYVQILSVTPYKSFPNSPLARTGVMKGGDVVLEVGGMWDLREPINDTSWAVLIEFIRETRRPLCMVVADANCLQPISDDEEKEEEGHQVKEKNRSDRDSDDDGDIHDKQINNNNGNEASDDSKRESSQESPELCTVSKEQLSIDALQTEVEENNSY